MRSLVMFVVEHGETTDPLTQFIDVADVNVPGCSRIDYDFRVDIGEDFNVNSIRDIVKVL